MTIVNDCAIQFSTVSGVTHLSAEQLLPVKREELWEFVADPHNLSVITPPDMDFKVTSGGDQNMYQGQIITYRVRPFPLVRSNWVTEISHMEEGRFFVDEQRLGPYRFWYHQHILLEHDAGCLMKDQVTYRLPLAWIGSLANVIVVRNRLKAIFLYRQRKLQELFGSVS